MVTRGDPALLAQSHRLCVGSPDDAVLVSAAAAAGRPAGGLAVAGLGPAARPAQAQMEAARVEAALPLPAASSLVHVRLDEDPVVVPSPSSLSLVLSLVEEPPGEAAVVPQGRRLGGRAVELWRGRVAGRGLVVVLQKVPSEGS